MKYTGRIVTFLMVLSINTTYILYYFARDGAVSPIEIIGLPMMLALAWWFGNQYDKAKYYSEKDTLTGIYNRRFLEACFPKIKAMTKRNGQKFAVLVIDINDFKMINDRLGHKEGDRVLKTVAQELVKSVRDADIVARWGGDEFVILSPDLKMRENIELIVQRIHYNLSAADLDVTVSIGTALYPDDGESFEDLLKVADHHMYAMKFQSKQPEYIPSPSN
ncbi:GGDEF domain-containing protein [Bacillus tianshenii]|nr:GGDEF domain-containing protein [Bacillus tianshenii]